MTEKLIGKLTVKQHRLIREISQEEMAEKVGVHVQTYRAWEENPEKISIAKAKKIAAAFNISINEIFFAN